MKSWIFFWNWYVLIPFYLSRHDIFSLGQVFKLSQTPIFLVGNFKNFAVSKMHFSVLKAFYDRYKNYWNLKFFFAIKCYNVLFSIWIWEYYSNVTVIIIPNSFLKVWNFKYFQPQNFHFNPVSMLSQRLKRFFKWKLKLWKVSKIPFHRLKAFYDRYKNYWNLKFFLQLNVIMFSFPSEYENITAM